jgi:phage tail-like protein
MANGKRKPPDPYLGFHFRVKDNDKILGAFSEVTGLQVEIEAYDYREGGVNDYIHKLAGPARYPSNLILKHGIVDANVLWKWQQEVIEGKIKRRQVSVVLLDSAGEAKWQWDFKDAYPVRWSGPDLRASTAEVAIETLELAHRGMTTQ